jgi:hypothetical protein
VSDVLKIIGEVVGGLAAYCSAGILLVLTVAWVNARTSSTYWFHNRRDKRWTDNQSQTDLPPPIAVFMLWPIFLLLVFPIYGIAGLFRVAEKIGDKLIEAGEESRRKVGNFREEQRR